MVALWRYWRQVNLVSFSNILDCYVDAIPNPTKERLADVVQRHFISQKQMDELQVILGFVQAAKRLKIVCK
ncbi:hypothetical protein FH972_010786 [Carpinus fangiana]|uniref:Histone deacetylase complex subunit SAP30 Sin3 binding domain-containing protein n=1 Tax=Carpinus fangiana TaxID=176857 RepID=A0A660KS91_9ROSI|nr:hypothetical protein FH972_010786 [Carpinus fangiana]